MDMMTELDFDSILVMSLAAKQTADFAPASTPNLFNTVAKTHTGKLKSAVVSTSLLYSLKVFLAALVLLLREQ